jgi:hypothetical protein
MNYTVGKINRVDPDKLQKLFDLIDDIGMQHEYSRDDGELSIYADGVAIMFEADQQLMEEASKEAFWREDAERIAEGFWRE